jgi:hypothetical protein
MLQKAMSACPPLADARKFGSQVASVPLSRPAPGYAVDGREGIISRTGHMPRFRHFHSSVCALHGQAETCDSVSTEFLVVDR